MRAQATMLQASPDRNPSALLHTADHGCAQPEPVFVHRRDTRPPHLVTREVWITKTTPLCTAPTAPSARLATGLVFRIRLSVMLTTKSCSHLICHPDDSGYDCPSTLMLSPAAGTCPLLVSSTARRQHSPNASARTPLLHAAASDPQHAHPIAADCWVQAHLDAPIAPTQPSQAKFIQVRHRDAAPLDALMLACRHQRGLLVVAKQSQHVQPDRFCCIAVFQLTDLRWKHWAPASHQCMQHGSLCQQRSRQAGNMCFT